jgi:hypothetical protein
MTTSGRHEFKQNTNGKYQCPFCPKEYVRVTTVSDHIEAKHDNESLPEAQRDGSESRPSQTGLSEDTPPEDAPDADADADEPEASSPDSDPEAGEIEAVAETEAEDMEPTVFVAIEGPNNFGAAGNYGGEVQISIAMEALGLPGRYGECQIGGKFVSTTLTLWEAGDGNNLLITVR